MEVIPETMHMNRSQSFFMLIILLASIACKKPYDSTLNPIDDDLNAKWNFTAYYIGFGGPVVNPPPAPPGQWIRFKNNGIFETHMPEITGARFALIDSLRLRIWTSLLPNSARTFYYKISPDKRQLELSSADVICIEGCGYIFTRD